MVKDNPIVHKASLQLLTPRIITYLDDKANLWIKNNLNSANVHERIGIMSGYNTISTNLKCGGYCDMWNKEIAIKEDYIQVVLHELSHSFQADLGITETLRNLLSDHLKEEQQCETMAKYLYQKIHHKTGDRIFTAYMDNHSLDFLRDWYKGSFIELDI